MGRPREFDEEVVLDRAMAVFWARGFDATSIQDIVDATGVGRASLYGAFGDKDHLFALIVERYAAHARTMLDEARAEASAARGIERLFTAWLQATCPKNGPRGCLMQHAATVADEPWARELLATHARDTEAVLTELITRGQRSGELGTKSEPRELARLFTVTLQGVAAAARAGLGRERLASALREAQHLLGAKPRTGT